jgi:phage shock protein E
VTRGGKTGILAGIALLCCFSVEGTHPAAAAAQAARLPPRANGFLTITPLEAKTLLEARSDVVIIDVRSPQEFSQGALPGSVLVPFFDAMRGKVLLPRDTPLLLVCAVGGRSLAVGRYLAMQGFQEVYNLKGGLEAWQEQRVPLPARKKTG